MVRALIGATVAAFVAALLAGSSSADASHRSASTGGQVAFSDGLGFGRVLLVDADGGPVRVLIKARDVSTFEWSPDGTKLVFVRQIRVGYDRGDPVARPAIFVINADGSGQRRLSPRGTHDQHPTWSPDGRKIAFERAVNGPGDDIWVMKADGSSARRLTHHPVLDREPTWSPDGQKIAWVRTWPDALHVMLMNADGSGEHRLLRSRLQTTNPAWSANGRSISVTGFDTKALYVVRPDGRDLTPVARNLSFDTVARWAPDSRRIVYSHDASLYVVYASGQSRGPRRLNSGYTADWSPDGTEIAFDDLVKGETQSGLASAVFVMRHDGTRRRRLVNGSNPAWRP